MTNEKTTPKKAVTKKVPVKKVEPKEPEITEEKAVETPSEAPIRKKRLEIDRNETIACRSTVEGKLVYISNRTKAKYLWHEFGDIQFIDMGELLDMRSSYPGFLNDVLLVVDDEEAAEYLGLTKKYESLVGVEDLDEFFNLHIDEMERIISKLPKGLKASIASKARQLIEDGTFDSGNKIRLLEEKLQIKLKIFEK